MCKKSWSKDCKEDEQEEGENINTCKKWDEKNIIQKY